MSPIPLASTGSKYRVELDMVLELVAWFSDREASSVVIPLTVT